MWPSSDADQHGQIKREPISSEQNCTHSLSFVQRWYFLFGFNSWGPFPSSLAHLLNIPPMCIFRGHINETKTDVGLRWFILPEGSGVQLWIWKIKQWKELLKKSVNYKNCFWSALMHILTSTFIFEVWEVNHLLREDIQA